MYQLMKFNYHIPTQKCFHESEPSPRHTALQAWPRQRPGRPGRPGAAPFRGNRLPSCAPLVGLPAFALTHLLSLFSSQDLVLLCAFGIFGIKKRDPLGAWSADAPLVLNPRLFSYLQPGPWTKGLDPFWVETHRLPTGAPGMCWHALACSIRSLTFWLQAWTVGLLAWMPSSCTAKQLLDCLTACF